MKKLLPVILAALLLLTACAPAVQEPEKPVRFYYLRQSFDYHGADGVITAELREGAGAEDILQLLERYFSGPTSAQLRAPFPAGVHALALEYSETTVTVTLSDNFATLSGMELTLACACITTTLLELLEAEQVCIKAESALLQDRESITMTPEDLLLLDNSKIVIAPE